MRLSSYVHALAVDYGWWGLYTPFDHKVMFVPDNAWKNLKASKFGNLKSTSLQSLIDQGFLVDEGQDEARIQELRSNAFTTLNAMFLVLTHRCNLACKYCVVEGNIEDKSRENDHMSVETGIKAVEMFARHLYQFQPREARVTFYGGEPLLNREVILATLPLIRRISHPSQSKSVDVVMITNGLKFDEEVASSLRAHGGAVCVSLDGKPEHHDAARVTKGGRATHAQALTSIKKYLDSNLRVGISCTIGHHNVENLPEIARYFATEIGILDIEFQTPYLVQGQGGNPLYVSMDTVTDQLLAAYDSLTEFGVPEFTTARRVQDFLSGRWRHRDCGAVGGQLVVSPTGQVGPCHSLVGVGTFFDGDVRSDNWHVADSDSFNEWSRRIPVNMPQCTSCSFIGLCGGGCAYNAYAAEQTIWGKDPQVCVYVSKIVDWLLQRLWKTSVEQAKTLNEISGRTSKNIAAQ